MGIDLGDRQRIRSLDRFCCLLISGRTIYFTYKSSEFIDIIVTVLVLSFHCLLPFSDESVQRVDEFRTCLFRFQVVYCRKDLFSCFIIRSVRLCDLLSSGSAFLILDEFIIVDLFKAFCDSSFQNGIGFGGIVVFVNLDRIQQGLQEVYTSCGGVQTNIAKADFRSCALGIVCHLCMDCHIGVRVDTQIIESGRFAGMDVQSIC